jgi:hypothetical protein
MGTLPTFHQCRQYFPSLWMFTRYRPPPPPRNIRLTSQSPCTHGIVHLVHSAVLPLSHLLRHIATRLSPSFTHRFLSAPTLHRMSPCGGQIVGGLALRVPRSSTGRPAMGVNHTRACLTSATRTLLRDSSPSRNPPAQSLTLCHSLRRRILSVIYRSGAWNMGSRSRQYERHARRTLH